MATSESFPRWSLKDLLPDPLDRSVEEHLSKLEKAVSDLEAMRDAMTPEILGKTFAKVLGLLESVNVLMRRLQAYSYLWLSEDTQNEAALNLRDRLDQSLVNFGNRILFFEIWFKDLPDAAAEKLIAQSGDLGYSLESIRRFKQYTLPTGSTPSSACTR